MWAGFKNILRILSLTNDDRFLEQSEDVPEHDQLAQTNVDRQLAEHLTKKRQVTVVLINLAILQRRQRSNLQKIMMYI